MRFLRTILLVLVFGMGSCDRARTSAEPGGHASGATSGGESQAGASAAPAGGVESGGAGGGGAGSGGGPSSGSSSGGLAAGSGGQAGAGRAGRAGSAGDDGPGIPPLGKTALLIGQSGRRAHVDYVLGTASVPAGGSVYAELYTGKFLSFEQAAFVDHLASYYPGSFVLVGLSWKDNRVNAGYCDLADPACVASGGAIAPELDIVRGRFDAAVDAFGELMKSYARLTFLVRVDYEVSPDMHCAPTDESDCPAYVNAFRYLRERWQRTEVKNVALVFHPTRGWAKQMYPGADLTDWIGFSVFNHDVCLTTPEGANGGCADGAHLDAGLAADFAWAAEQGKPILIAESTVQKPSDESAEGFNEYLTRLFELVNEHPQVRGLTYINMKWAGGFIYGEDWTQGAFGNVDSRLTHFPETRSYFCRTLGGRYLGLGGKPLACDDPDLKPLPLPPDLDAPVHERLVFLGNNRCVGAMGTGASGGDALVQGDCGTLGSNGQGRFRILERAGSAKIWSDRSWQCWSAEGEGLLQRPCADAVSQSFVLEPVSGAGSARDVRVRASSGACVAAAVDAPADAPLIVAPCNGSSFEVLRL